MSGYVVCRSCGTRIKAGRPFCLKCFEPLPDPAAAVPTPPWVSLGLSPTQQSVLIAAGVLAVLVLVAVIWETRPVPVDDQARPVARTAGGPASPSRSVPIAQRPSPSTSAAPRIEPFERTPAGPPAPAKADSADIASLEATRASYDEELLKKPDDSDLLNRKGQLLERLGRFDEAATCFERAIALAPQARGYHFNLARAATTLGQSDRALAEYREIVRLQPDDYAARYSLAVALQKRGDHEAAVVELEKTVALAPSDPGAHLSLGLSLERIERIADAVREYQRYVAMQPDSVDGQRLKEHLAALAERP